MPWSRASFTSSPPAGAAPCHMSRSGSGRFSTYRAQRYRVVLDGAAGLDTTALLVVFANARQYGNGAIIAPRARVDDGRLDAVIVDDRSLPRHLWRVRHLFRGTADRAEGAITQTVERALVESDAPMAIHADGEPLAPATRTEVRVIPGAIRVAY